MLSVPRGVQEAVERPIWRRLTELYSVSEHGLQDRILEGSLSDFVEPFRMWDVKGILLGDEMAMHTRADYALAWVREALALQHCEGWKFSELNVLADFVKSFYHPGDIAIAFVFVESCRLQIRKLFGAAYQERLQEHHRPTFSKPKKWLNLIERLRLPLKGLRFALPPERSWKDTSLVKMTLRRVFGSGISASEGEWTSWCAATQGEDNASVAKAIIPAGRRCIHATGVNGARLMTWAKLYPLTGLTVSYSLDLDPLTGEIISVRYATAPLWLHTGITPHWQRLLLQYVGG